MMHPFHATVPYLKFKQVLGVSWDFFDVILKKMVRLNKQLLTLLIDKILRWFKSQRPQG